MSIQDSPHLPNESPSGSPGGSDALVRDGAWLQRLARRLVHDGQRADDAVQMTLIAAWERGLSSTPPSRPWLARVLRNSLLQGLRSDVRRAHRQSKAVRTDTVESPQTTAERLELQRCVLDTVESLDEPYRTTIVLRFLDDLSPRAIAARTNTPVKTVHTRIERGLARLRRRLDDVW